MAIEIARILEDIIAAEDRLPPAWAQTARQLQADLSAAVDAGSFPASMVDVAGDVRHTIRQHAGTGKEEVVFTYTRAARDAAGVLLGAGKLTVLGEKETRVLEQFLAHPATVLSGDDLQRAGDVASPQALRHLMYSLRRKLQDQRNAPHVLHSVRGGWMYTRRPVLRSPPVRSTRDQ